MSSLPSSDIGIVKVLEDDDGPAIRIPDKSYFILSDICACTCIPAYIHVHTGAHLHVCACSTCYACPSEGRGLVQVLECLE